jgi:methylated-DNA-[protein]-cysteine S-methyltransferase
LLSLVLFDSCLGWMGIISSSLGIKKFILPQKSKEEVLLQVREPYIIIKESDFAVLSDLSQRLRHYLTGEPVHFPDKLDLRETTSFQQRVWKATQTIPYGETRSYAQLAGQLGQDKAARAVGQALSKNPLPIIIPCHRVVNSDGRLGGFSAGLKLKKYLLCLEARKQTNSCFSQ